MNRQTGFPAARLARVPYRRAAALTAVILLAAFLSSPVARVAAVEGPAAPARLGRASDKKTPADDSITASLNTIARAFRNQEPRTLASILPSGGKVLLVLRTVGQESGYYGRDQVYFIFRKIFRLYETVHFEIRVQEEGPPGARRKGLTHCIGTWSYEERDGGSGKCQLFFALSMKNGNWTLLQIREAL